jgi:enterobactin synthetase component D
MQALSTIQTHCANHCVTAGEDPFQWINSLEIPFIWNLHPSISESTSSVNVEVARQKRQIEFASGRRSAESLLKRLGNSQQVWVNPDRSPDWPNGFTGSISHSNSWTWVAVGRKTQLKSIGIDTETVVSTETRSQIQQDIATPNEWEVAESTGLTANQIFSLVFSAKEAFYKCWYPLTEEYFGFEHALVDAATPSSLVIRMTETNPNFHCGPETFEVHFFATDDDVFTMTWMEQN